MIAGPPEPFAAAIRSEGIIRFRDRDVWWAAVASREHALLSEDLDEGRHFAVVRPRGSRSVTERPPLRSNILVVEDDQANRQLLVRLLSRHGYTVESVTDGEAALAAVDIRLPDLILLDVQLPGIDGFEICRRLKQRVATRLIPIVLVTGLNDRQNKMSGIEAGADDFLSKPFDMQELTARVASLVRLKRYTDELESAESVIISLALTVEARDPYTEGHCQRLARFATALGAQLKLADDQIAALQRGGYLHDVGKIGVPDAVLQKPAKLTTAEYETMKRHTLIGEKLCGELRSLSAVRPIVRHHHERRDGSGYPDGLRGDDIPLLAQIVGIVDTYDAITTTRPYRQALPARHAYQELTDEAARGLHSLDLIEEFLALARSGRLDGDGPPR
jgi:putative two-component system response regulator